MSAVLKLSQINGANKTEKLTAIPTPAFKKIPVSPANIIKYRIAIIVF